MEGRLLNQHLVYSKIAGDVFNGILVGITVFPSVYTKCICLLRVTFSVVLSLQMEKQSGKQTGSSFMEEEEPRAWAKS